MTAFIVFSFCLAVQIGYWSALALGFRRQLDRFTVAPDAEYPPISVIIAARNEAQRLPALLESVAVQDYDRFEVLIVDDGSTDATAEVVRRLANEDDRFRLIETTPEAPRKKNALQTGIEQAKYERLAFTDADCRPGPGWLKSIAEHAPDADRVVVGYSPFDREPGPLNAVSRYETFVTAFLTAAAIGLNRPYMAVGRSLSYSKTLFRRIGGFDHSIRSMSGDDDLLIQQVDRSGGAVVHMNDPASFVRTAAPGRWAEWIRQKHRHASASRFYRPFFQAHLVVFHMSGHVLWLAPFLAGLPGVGLLLARVVVQTVALRRAAREFREQDLLMLQPLWELFYALYNVFVAPLGVLWKPRKWTTGRDR